LPGVVGELINQRLALCSAYIDNHLHKKAAWRGVLQTQETLLACCADLSNLLWIFCTCFMFL